MNNLEPREYNPAYQRYIDLVEEGTLLELLRENSIIVEKFLNEISEEKFNHRYAPNKWTIKQVVMHIIDTERVFAYRTLVSIRGDKATILYSMDENLYASNVDVSSRTKESLVKEFLVVRKNSELLFEYLSDEQSKILRKVGEYETSPRALGYFMIGHVKHHLKIISERYL